MIAEKLFSFLTTLLSISVLSYLGFGAYLYLFQHRFVYFPDKTIQHTPKVVGLTFENVFFTAEDDVKLHGWYIPRENAQGTILFCHGNAGNIGDRMGTLAKCHEFGFNVFIFDYRGFGRSEGRLSEKGTYRDAEAAWNYLIKTRGESAEKIILYGRSLGGAVASWLAKTVNPKLFIIEGSFTSVEAVGADAYPFLPIRFLSRFHYPTEKNIQKIQCPILVLHSSDDETIPIKHGKALFDAAPEPKEFVELMGDHGNGFLVSGKVYDDGIRGFIEKYYR